MSPFERLRRTIVHRILGVGDTPRRIAWGMFLGTMVGFTPTLGFQIMIYLALATLLRANKISGIPILFISNPLTAVPLYWSCWRVGAWVLGTDVDREDVHLEDRLAHAESEAADTDLWTYLWTHLSWADLWQPFPGMC